jgi:superfamily II DNA or RNA helicase
MSRYQVYKTFRHYKQGKEAKSMDEICINNDDKFKLQIQQLFLQEFIIKHTGIKNLLFYHEIGSGKTCTAITVAEAYIQSIQIASTQIAKATIILPARLRTNFIDELVGPCGFQKYISDEDLALYRSHTTPKSTKNRISKQFTIAINRNYNILSYEGFVKMMMQNKSNIIEFIQKWTKNNIIIVDEAHNIFSTKYDINVYNSIYQSGIIQRSSKGMAAILMNLIVRYSDESCKLIYLTATPIFNNLDQLSELVKVMTPDVELPKKTNLRQLIELLRGKVSYFPGVSKNAYPSVEYKNHNIMITSKQDQFIHLIAEKNEDESLDDNDEDAFMLKQRLAELSLLDKTQIHAEHLEEYAPKIKLLVENIESSVGKQIVYTNFVDSSINIIQKILVEKGWYNILQVANHINDPISWEQYKNRTFAIWSGDTNDQQKQLIKTIINGKTNIFGEYIKLIIGSPSIKEGISFLNIQDMHIIDPVWNMSAKNQIEGRVIRYCSHIDINEVDDAPLKRKVNIHYYKLVHNPNGLVEATADEIIYDKIIPEKHKFVALGEKYLKKVAIDYHLFKNMYKSPRSTSPKSGNSSISYSDEDTVVSLRHQKEKQCPKDKTPINGICKEGYEIKRNKSRIPCCYKKNISASKTLGCAIDTIQIHGKCPNGHAAKTKKDSVQCCKSMQISDTENATMLSSSKTNYGTRRITRSMTSQNKKLGTPV